MNAVDTNVLIYACDQRDVRRQRLALDLITTTPDCGPAVAGGLRIHRRQPEAEHARIHIPPRMGAVHGA